MSPLLLVLALAVSGAAAEEPTEKPWPQKKDTIYVSAELVLHVGVGSSTNESEIPACIPMEVRKAKPRSEKWTLRSPNSGEIWSTYLRGPWRPRMHRSASECNAYFEVNGQPVIARRTSVHQIIPPDPE